MNSAYDHKNIEEKWQKVWEQKALFQDSLLEAEDVNSDNKVYLLFAFSYPSGEGLHVGHVESSTALDILARFHRMNGKNVFFPVGWDAFGLPAENFAIKTGVHPSITTKKAIDTFKGQLKRIGISYDWKTEIATSHEEYYKWTQWIFLQMYKEGLAYKADGKVNWCPSCQTVLANEQVVDGKCERCETEITQKQLAQWFYKITDYKDELISGLDEVDWPQATKDQQINWIGRKEGINITYPIEGTKKTVTCFTTRPDTNYGATFIVIAPEHGLVDDILNDEIDLGDSEDDIKFEITKYVQSAKKKSELDRIAEGTTKTGVFTGLYAINHLTGYKMPIWVSDFVLTGVGTGAVVGVPGHDKRDFQFAQKFGLKIIRVVVASDEDKTEITKIEQVQEEEGIMINSDFLDGKDIHLAKKEIMEYMVQKGWGEMAVSYRLRDWLISRQRYWGAPIPIVYDPSGKAHPVKEEHLPWKLPVDVDFKPHGESPLKSSKEFIERTEKLYGKGWKPEFDTMDTFVDSSWYYLRYLSARDQKQAFDPKKVEQWMPVDLYMIGPEHIVLHLLYSRFFTKFFRDQGYLKFNEPFKKMRHQGMILGPNHKKMSKSKGNVINPDDVVAEYGADTLRVYEMFMGPIEAEKPWDTKSIAGSYRFLNRVYKLSNNTILANSSKTDPKVKIELHKLIKKVTSDIKELKFNTAIAKMMEFVNLWEKQSDGILVEDLRIFVKLLSPFAPFLAEEIYQLSLTKDTQKVNQEFTSIHLQSWPEYAESLVKEDAVTIVIQVNGKVKGLLHDVAVNQAEEQITELAKEIVVKQLEQGNIVKTIYVKDKLINFLVK